MTPEEIPYKPAPADLHDIVLPPDVAALTEILARNTHEAWAQRRMEEGWVYGVRRDDRRKTHPGLVPYDQLSEAEKDYDRATAVNALKLIVKLGYRLVK